MFMRVNSKCAHQVRPPRGRIQLSAVVEETLGDYSLPLPEARQNVRLRGLFSRGGQPVLPNSDQCLCGDFARDLGACQTQLTLTRRRLSRLLSRALIVMTTLVSPMSTGKELRKASNGKSRTP
jgi:hypothetical protein